MNAHIINNNIENNINKNLNYIYMNNKHIKITKKDLIDFCKRNGIKGYTRKNFKVLYNYIIDKISNKKRIFDKFARLLSINPKGYLKQTILQMIKFENIFQKRLLDIINMLKLKNMRIKSKI